ncbi:PREDICTED: uncharacterized protein LOC108971116 [Bactrocera latifrons]|uniref:Uncharacterized protein n=1 Tax=Bactrocera latifrons TaxID=174628 RepID=A0A0K8W163_BACLA|nr:PREDICTED: uncharacterized protein LOC108971116 [Bactrocera latifrons]
MKFVLTLVTLCTLLNGLAADDVKESRYIDENALKAFFDFTRQTKTTSPAAGLKSQYPYLSQKEKLTLQGERQTHYPLQPLNVEFALLPQTVMTQQPRPITHSKDKLVDVKPIYIPYALKNQPAFTQAAFEALTGGLQAHAEQPKLNYVTSYPLGNPSAEQTKVPAFYAAYPKIQEHKPTSLQSNIALESKQPAYQTFPNLFAYANQSPNQFAYQQPYQHFAAPASSPSFIIINPTNYPSYHYYNAPNYTFPRDEALELVEVEEHAPDFIKDLRLENVHHVQPSSDGSSAETEAVLNNLPHTLTNDERLLAQALLQQSRQPDNSNALLELLKREQLKRRMQEQVAAFYFRNYNLSKK